MSRKTLQATEFATGLIFGEGPRWHDGSLYISDMLAGQILAFDSAGQRRLIIDVPNRPNGMAFMPDGVLLFTSMLDGKVYRLERSGPVLHADIAPLVTGYLGDVVVDDAGRAYIDDVGSRVFEDEPVKPGRLIVVEPDGHASVAAEDFAFANGIAITSDRRTLIVAESMTQRLNAFDIGADGALSRRRIYKDLSKLDLGTAAVVAGTPDGIAIDAEDALWISMPTDGKFVRIDPSGAVTHVVDVGDEHPIACALGGVDGRTLFMSSSQVARDLNFFEEMANKRTKTHLLTTRVDVPHGKGLP